jgi:hypothetical protein
MFADIFQLKLKNLFPGGVAQLRRVTGGNKHPYRHPRWRTPDLSQTCFAVRRFDTRSFAEGRVLEASIARWARWNGNQVSFR